MSDKSVSSKRFGRSTSSSDSQLAETKAQLAASEDTRHTLETLMQQKVEEVTELQRNLHKAEQNIVETRTETEHTNAELQKQLGELFASNGETQGQIGDKQHTIQSLETELKTAVESCERMEAQEASLRTELRKEKQKSEALQVEYRSKETENQQLRAQLKAAMKDLAIERDNHSKTEESRRSTSLRIEELLAMLEEIQISNEEEKQREREKNDDLWKQNTTYLYTAAISACATAVVVSIFFRSYKKN